MEQTGPRCQPLGAIESGQRRLGEGRPQLVGHGDLGLPEEVAHHLGWVVPPGVLEVHEPDGAVRLDEGVVEPEIRRRQAAVAGRQVAVTPTVGALDPVADVGQRGHEPGGRQGGGFAVEVVADGHGREPLHPPGHGAEVVLQAEAGLGGERQVGGGRDVPVAVEGVEERPPAPPGRRRSHRAQGAGRRRTRRGPGARRRRRRRARPRPRSPGPRRSGRSRTRPPDGPGCRPGGRSTT